MSKFKLDFDISSHRRAVPRNTCKTRKPTGPTGPTERSAGDDPDDPANPDDSDDSDDASDTTKLSVHTTTPSAPFEFTVPLSLPRLSLRFLFGFIVVFAGAVCLFPILYVHDTTGKHAVTISRCNKHNNAVTCQSACGVRGNCNTPRVVSFDTKRCADEVHTVHLHDVGGAARRVPAFHLRIPNTSMFEFVGDRGIFRPADCQAEMRDVLMRAAPTPETQSLQGYLWWISGKSVHSFDVVRGTKIIAELDASVVLHRCYSNTHCVFKLPMPCRVAKEAHVFGQDSPGQKKAETFVFC